MLLPVKKSIQWLYVFIIVFVLNLFALLGDFLLLDLQIVLRNVIGFAIISAVVALIASVGYFGVRLFSLVVIISNIAAIGYMYYIVLANRSPGWIDLASFAGYITILAIGIIAGLIVQVIYLIVMWNKNKGERK